MTRVMPATLTAFLFILLCSCQRHADGVGGVSVFDGRISLTREAGRDYLERKIIVPAAATLVVLVEENDGDIKLSLAASPANAVEVESLLVGKGIEVAALTVPAGAEVTVALRAPAETRDPTDARMRILRYDANLTGQAAIARVKAFQDWTQATLAGSNITETRRRNIALMQGVIAHFESAQGDARLAAWGHVVSSMLSYTPDVSWNESLVSARKSLQAFAAMKDERNSARAQFRAGEALLQLMVKPDAVDPTAEEASQEAKRIFESLSAPDSPLSRIERGWASINLIYHAYQLDRWEEASEYGRRALAEMRAAGYRRGEMIALANLGTLAAEAGNYREATTYHDQVIAQLRTTEVSVYTRTLFIFNAANADAYSGRSERALERYLLGLQVSRESGSRSNEARMLHGLGHVYLTRGDLMQAGTFYAEALAIRRTLDDYAGTLASLRMNGLLARETGDVAQAIRLHREAEAKSLAPHTLLRARLELALDYAAAGDAEQAMKLCREALGPGGGPDSVKADETRLTLAGLLLGKGLVNDQEAQKLIEHALQSALRRSDTLLEMHARRMRAQLLVRRRAFDEARAEYERAIRLIYEYRSQSTNPELQAATLASEQQTFRGYVDLLMRDVAARASGRLAIASSAEEQALRTLEFARALNFRPPRDPRVDGATQARIDELLARMAEKRVRIATFTDRSAPSKGAEERLQVEMARLRAELDRIRARAVGARAAEELPASAFSWGTLGPATAQVSYALGERHAYLWLRDERGIWATALAESPAQIERRLDALLAADRLRSPETLEPALARLSEVLVPAGMLRNAGVVEIIADGKLASIPFAALRSPTDASRRLVETHVVRIIASMLETPRTGTGTGAVASLVVHRCAGRRCRAARGGQRAVRPWRDALRDHGHRRVVRCARWRRAGQATQRRRRHCARDP